MTSPRIPDSRKFWLDLGLFYCSKRETSGPRLRRYFQRKIREYRIPEDQIPQQIQWIDSVLEEFASKRIIDHERYAGIVLRDLKRRGKGRRYIEQKMKEKGLDSEIPGLRFEAGDELELAETLARKTLSRTSIQRLGDPHKIRARVLQKLVSSGFDLGTAKKAVELAFNHN
jgi:SOS response regulatory protein OraA/RecX